MYGPLAWALGTLGLLKSIEFYRSQFDILY